MWCLEVLPYFSAANAIKKKISIKKIPVVCMHEEVEGIFYLIN